MSIEKFIVSKDTSSFTNIPNKVLQGLKNYEALGLYSYLISLPPGWELYKDQLRKRSNIGRDKLNKLLKILQNHGLIVIKRMRCPNGTLGHNDFRVKDGSEFEIPIENNDVSTSDGKPGTGNQALVNSSYKENNNKLNKNKKSFCDSKEKNPPKKTYDNAKKHSWADKPKPKAPLANVDTQSNSHRKYSIDSASLDIREQYMTKIKHSIGMRV